MNNENDKKSKGSFWTTVPGCLTGIAALITAIAGLIAVLFQIGVLKLPSSVSEPTTDPNIQIILLRESCGSDYIVNANEPISIYYGGWGVMGIDLAQQWATSLTTSITIDGTLVSGEQHPPADKLPFNCAKDKEDVYWLFYTTTFSGFSSGVHEILVTYNTQRALPDELGGKNYEPGIIAEATFKIIAK